MKNPCSIFLATEENEQNNNNNTFLEDDVIDEIKLVNKLFEFQNYF